MNSILPQQDILIFIAFSLSVICGLFTIPLIMRFCRSKGLYDHPGGRKVHKTDVPRLGGISFFPIMVLAALVIILTHNKESGMDNKISLSTWTLTFLFSILIVYCVGIVDDIIGLGAKTKFLVQIVAALALPLSGLYINHLYGFLGIWDIPYSVGLPLTVFVIVFACNAINLIDGIDGLSSGLSFVALAGFLALFMRDDLFFYSVLIAGLMGVVTAFAYFNIFGSAKKQHKIFMGDSGSLTLGFILGFLFVKHVMWNPSSGIYHEDALSSALSLVVVPMFDVVRVSMARLAHHRHVFQADKNHIHHKLMRFGLSQHQALCAILALALLFIALHSLLYPRIGTTLTVAADIAVWTLLNHLLNMGIRSKGQLPFVERN